MRRLHWLGGACVLWAACACVSALGAAPESKADEFADIDAQFSRQVDHRLVVPTPLQTAYFSTLETALTDAGITGLAPQLILAVDRKPFAWAGRFLVVIDSQTTARPSWAANAR